MKFSRESRCILYGTHMGIVQNMLDYDYLCGRGPSVAAVFSSQASGKKYKVMYGDQELFIPTIHHWEEVDQFAHVDTLINLASFRSATRVNKEAIASGKFRHIFTIAEGIAERETRELIALAAQHQVSMIGPSTVGGMIVGVFRIGHTGGSLDNIVQSRLYQPGSVGIVSKSGGMMNELCRVVSKQTDGVHTAFQVGGDRFPMTSFVDVVRYYESVEGIRMIVLLGEVGNRDELVLADMVKRGELTKPIVARCIGTSAEGMEQEVQFGHAGAKANHDEEQASYKNQLMQEVGIHVPASYDGFGEMIGQVYNELSGIDCHASAPSTHNDVLEKRNGTDQELQRKLAVLRGRRKTRFTSTISDERGDELLYNGIPVSEFVQEGSIARVIGHLWLKRELPPYALKFLTTALILMADHGPAVSGATNTIITTRAGKDIVSSLIAGLATIGPRFGGAIDGAARWLSVAVRKGQTAPAVVAAHKQSGRYIQGIGHKIKSKYNPDARCTLLGELAADFPINKHFALAKEVESLTLQKKPSLILNVDGHVAALLLDMFVAMEIADREIQQYLDAGIANALFVLARSIGFIGHALDQQRLNEGLYRTPWEDVWYGDHG